MVRNIKGMVRRDDHDTSIDAAVRVSRDANHLQGLVIKAFREHGPMTDGELERLPEFQERRYSTARKRRSELYHAEPPRIIKTKFRRDGQAVWSLPDDRRIIKQYGFG